MRSIEGRLSAVVARQLTTLAPQVLLCAAGVLLVTPLAVAQTDQSQTAAAQDAPELGEVVVTAQKREERLVDVPLAISAINADTLVKQNLVSLRDFFAKVPGISYNGGAGLQDIAIRGISTGGGGNPTVAVTIDDVPFNPATFVGYGASRSPDLDPSDLERIEVLRGPQGTLYGASSLGGLIKYVTKKPDLNSWHASGAVGGTTVHDGEQGYSFRGSLNAPLLEDRLGMRLSGFYRRDAGFIDHVKDPATGFGNNFDDANDTITKGGRASWLFKTGPVSIGLSALVQKVEGFDEPTSEYTRGFDYRSRDLSYSGGLTRTPYSNFNRLFNGTVNADLGFADLASSTAFGFTRYATALNTTATFSDYLSTIGFPVGNASTLNNRFGTKKFTQEVRLGKQDGIAWDWLVGAFYMKEKSKSPQTLDVQDPNTGEFIGNAATFDTSGNIREEAGFFDLAYNFSERLDVQAGVRFSHNKQEYHDIGDGPLNGGHSVTQSASKDSPVTWLFSPRFHINSDTMVYARIASGYRTGGPNTGLPGIPLSFKSDSTVNYELGFKAVTADRAISFDASAYWIDWDRIQIQTQDPVTTYIFFTNGSKARSRGLEMTLEWRPTSTTTLAANGTLNDAKLTDALPPTASVLAESGDRLPFSAKWSGNLSADQDFPLGADVTGYVGGTLTYLGRRPQVFTPIASTPRLNAPSYTTFDLRAGVRYSALTVNLFANNVTDKRGFTGLLFRNINDPSIGYSASVITPRTIGISMAYDY